MAENEPVAELPEKGRLLGVDYGSKRIGFAVSDFGRAIASPLVTLRNDQSLAKHLKTLVGDNEPVGLVIGLPVHMSGDEGEKAALARAFGQKLSSLTNLPAVFHDERYTSSMAEDAMREAGLSREKRQAKIDMLAAQFILQSFLDSGGKEQAPQDLRT